MFISRVFAIQGLLKYEVNGRAAKCSLYIVDVQYVLSGIH